MKTLILATAAVLALGAGSAFAAGTATQTQQRMNDTQAALQAQHSYMLGANSTGTVVYSGSQNELYPVPQGG